MTPSALLTDPQTSTGLIMSGKAPNRVIIAGGKDIVSYQTVCDAVGGSGFYIDRILSGGAAGVDTNAKRYAMEHLIPFTEYPAQWDKFGRAAGPIRNTEMALHADALIAIWDGESKGTGSMIRIAHQHGLRVYVLEV